MSDALAGRRMNLFAAEAKKPFVIDVGDDRPGVPFPRKPVKRSRGVAIEQLNLF